MSFFRFLFQKGDLPKEEKKALRVFQKNLGYVFSDVTYLKRALSHKSYIHENKLSVLEHNERYEFLGDAILDFAVSALLMEFFPEADEGDLSKLRAAVVNESALALVARNIKIGESLFLGKGEIHGQGREKDSLLADAFEAVIGAVYLDSGFEKSFAVVKKHFSSLLEKATREDIITDYKTKLQEEVQMRFKTMPRYEHVAQTGPDHDKLFSVNLIIQKEIFATGSGRSKKQAEQSAAKEVLIKLNQDSSVSKNNVHIGHNKNGGENDKNNRLSDNTSSQ